MYYDEMPLVSGWKSSAPIPFSEVTGPDHALLCVFLNERYSYHRQLWLLTREEMRRVNGWFEVPLRCTNYSGLNYMTGDLTIYHEAFCDCVGAQAIVVEVLRRNEFNEFSVYPKVLAPQQPSNVWFESEADAVDFSMRLKSDDLRFGIPYLYANRDTTEQPATRRRR